MRRHFAPLIAGVLLAALLPITAQPAVAAKRKKKPVVRVQVKVLNPSTLQANGTNANIKLKVIVKNAKLNSVWALGKVSGGATGEWARLNAKKKNVYAGRFNVPGNPSARPTTAEIYVNVRTSAGDVQRIVKRLTVGAGDDRLPPPPPAR